GIDGLRSRTRIAPDALILEGSLPLATRTWLNVIAKVTPDAGGRPRLTVRAGSVPLPPSLAEPAADLALKFLWEGAGPAPTFAAMLERVGIADGEVSAVLDVPLDLTRSVRKLGGPVSPATAMAARATFRAMTARPREPVPLIMLYREAFRTPVAAEIASGRMIGIAAALVSPSVLRMADPNADAGLMQVRGAARATVAGRPDLAKHLALSAALASGNSTLGAALGEWKELADSLPGGSGFSFVDLAADRAGTRLGKALADPERTARTQQLLARAASEDIFPTTALGLAEGLSDTEFETRFGQLDSMSYQAAVARIDAALDRLPLYGSGS
ncbi:MAG: hypothetical protein AAF205_03990, partial [Pseudomonadota bacterium]